MINSSVASVPDELFDHTSPAVGRNHRRGEPFVGHAVDEPMISHFLAVTAESLVGMKRLLPAKAIEINGGRTRIRTLDPLIKSFLFLPIQQWVGCKGNDFVMVQHQLVRREM